MGRDLDGARSARERDLHGRVLHESRSAWIASLHGARSALGALTGWHPGAAVCCGIGADERCGGLIVLAWRGFVVLAEQSAAHIATAAQARAPAPTRVVATS